MTESFDDLQRAWKVQSERRHTAAVDADWANTLKAWSMVQHAGREVLDLAVFLAGDAFQLPLPNAGFDVVWIRFVLQHIPQPEAVLREAVRVLRPGGKILLWDWDESLFVTSPASAALQELIHLRGVYGQEIEEIQVRLIHWNSAAPGLAVGTKSGVA